MCCSSLCACYHGLSLCQASYGFLFSVPVFLLKERWQFEVKSFGEVEGGVVGREPMGGAPQVQRVAVSSAFETMEGILFDIDREGSCGAFCRSVQRTGAALLRSSFGTWLKAEQLENLCDVDERPQGGEVNSGRRTAKLRRRRLLIWNTFPAPYLCQRSSLPFFRLGYGGKW